jgi:hypothetical protein
MAHWSMGRWTHTHTHTQRIKKSCDKTSIFRFRKGWTWCHRTGSRGWTACCVWQTVHLEAGVDEKYLDGSYRCKKKNVAGANCHSRRFVGWTDSVGRIAAWSVCRWTDRLGTLAPATDRPLNFSLLFFASSDSPLELSQFLFPRSRQSSEIVPFPFSQVPTVPWNYPYSFFPGTDSPLKLSLFLSDSSWQALNQLDYFIYVMQIAP